MDKGIDNSIKQYIDSVINQNIGLTKAYLFGSYAKNNNNDSSDIDIALILDNINDDELFDAQVRLLILASRFDNRIEPHIISYQDFKSDNPFVNEILKTGIEIPVEDKN